VIAPVFRDADRDFGQYFWSASVFQGLRTVQREVMTSTPNMRNRAQSYFKSSEQRENSIRAELEKERAAVDAKTARLRTLRLAKEAEDKIEADRQTAAKLAQKGSNIAEKSARAASRRQT
jgi:hypothetical protein